jgi:hypothetical protein
MKAEDLTLTAFLEQEFYFVPYPPHPDRKLTMHESFQKTLGRIVSTESQQNPEQVCMSFPGDVPFDLLHKAAERYIKMLGCTIVKSDRYARSPVFFVAGTID